MAGSERLIQRYADLLESEGDAELLRIVAELDEAASPFRRSEPPARLDQAIQQIARQRRVPSLNGRSLATVELESPASSAGHARLPTRLRTGWFRHGLEMVAAVLVLVLVAGVLATVLRGEGQSERGGIGAGGVATSSPTPLDAPTASSPSQTISLPPSAKLASKEAASQWAVADASPPGGPSARVVQAQLMTLADAMRQDSDSNWRQAIPKSADLTIPVWVVEVDGASIDHSCPAGSPRLACVYTHIVLVVDALTGQFVGMNTPHAAPATPQAQRPSTTPGTQPRATTGTASGRQPLSQEASAWSAVIQAVGTTIDPMLKPAQLPDAFETIRIVNAAPGAFRVEYDGQGKQLDIGVSTWNPSLCGEGCTQSQITVRGQQATVQVNDAYAGHVTLWWSEPGTWAVPNQPRGVEYLISADGLTVDEVTQIAESLVPVND